MRKVIRHWTPANIFDARNSDQLVYKLGRAKLTHDEKGWNISGISESGFQDTQGMSVYDACYVLNSLDMVFDADV